MNTEAPLFHQATGRTLRAGLIILAVWGFVLLTWLVIDLSVWIALIVIATTLPAAWDFASARQASLALDTRTLRWRSGRASGEVALNRLDHVRLETRLDLSIRVRLVLQGGRRITLPQDCLPAIAALKDALDARGVETRRHHFSLLS